MLLKTLVMLILVVKQIREGRATPAEVKAEDTKGELKKQLDILTNTMAEEIAKEGAELLHSHTKLSEKELNLKFKDIGFAVLVKSYPILRNIWSIDSNAMVTSKQILDGLNKSEALHKLEEEGKGTLSTRSATTPLDKAKLAATKFIQTVFTRFSFDKKDIKKPNNE